MGAWEWAQEAHIGGRDEQQDRSLVLASATGECCFAVLADGMGGHEGGSQAAQAVIETAERWWYGNTLDTQQPDEWLKNVCLDAHAAVHALRDTPNLDPYTTVVAVYLTPEQAWWIHVGDSRLYQFAQDELVTRTRDHSYLEVLVDQGLLAEDAMAQHPRQNVLLSALGDSDPLQLVHGHATVAHPAGFVLCSDGLWETVSVPEMSAALAQPNLQSATQDLVSVAVERGGTHGDNVSAILVRSIR